MRKYLVFILFSLLIQDMYADVPFVKKLFERHGELPFKEERICTNDLAELAYKTEILTCPIKTVDLDELPFTGSQLFIFGESVWYDAIGSGNECYRLISFPALRNPTITSFYIKGNKYYVQYKTISNWFACNEAAKIWSIEKEISYEQWVLVRITLKLMNFWNLSRGQELYSQEAPWDPNLMVIEAICGKQYHAVIRVECGQNKLFSDTFRTLEESAFREQH